MRALHKTAALRAFACVGLIVIGIVFALVFRVPPHLVVDTGPASTTVGPITTRTAFVERITVPKALRLSSLEVLLATWGKPTNTTHDEIRVFDGAGRLIQTRPLPPGSVADNSYVRVELPHPIRVSAGGSIFIALSSADGTATDSITAWSSPSSPVGRLYTVAGAALDSDSPGADVLTAHPRPGSISVRVTGLGRLGLAAENVLRVLGLLVLVALAAAVWWADTLKRWCASAEAALRVQSWRRGASITWFYLVVALVWGVAMILITPPFQAPDEPAHYFRAWSVADFQLIAQPGGVVTVPDNVATLADRLGSNVGNDWAANDYSARRAAGILWEPISETSRAQVTRAAGYAPIGYVPEAVGIEIARVLGHSPLLALYLGRLLNLVAAVVLVFFAIRVAPFGKPLLALVALLPMFVFEAASLSPDALALSGSLLLLALVLRSTTRETVPTRELILMSGVAAVLLNAKPGYAVLVLLVFMLVPRHVGGVRRYAVWVGATVAAAFGVAAVVSLVAPQMPASHAASAWLAGVDAGRQIEYVVRHPFEFAQVLYNTFDQQLLGNDHSRLGLGQMAYGVLGWLAIDLPTVGMWAMALAGILFLGSREAVPTTPWQRLVLSSTAVVFAIGISVAFYTVWSNVAAPVVNGLQGRYFIPVIPLAIFAVYGLRPTRERTILLILAVAVGIAAFTTVGALLRFYL